MHRAPQNQHEVMDAFKEWLEDRGQEAEGPCDVGPPAIEPLSDEEAVLLARSLSERFG